MYIKRSIKFLLHTRKKGNSISKENLPIRMRISYGGNKPLDFPLGHRIDAANWENERAIDDTVNKQGQTALDINRTIDEYRSFMNEIFARYELLEKRMPEPAEIKDLFNDMTGRSKLDLSTPAHDFFKLFDTFTKTVGEKNAWSIETYVKFKALKKDLEDFEEKTEKIELNSINEEKMQAFVRYLSNKGLRNTTINDGKISFLKWFLRWASQKEYYTGTEHNTFKPKLKGVDGNSKEIIYLTKEEIKALQNHQFKDGEKHLERVCDVFLFCCFTGLRYSDVAKLTTHDVKKGYIQIVTQKTVDGIKIELNKHSQAILDKYKNAELPRNKALPVISNVKMNEYLKTLGEVCEINAAQRIVYFIGNVRHEETFPKYALLTTHCGRRTFVVNSLLLGIPAEVIMKWTGHSDFDAMKPYIKIVDELKEREMSKFNDF